MQDWEAALVRLETCDRELCAQPTPELTGLAAPAQRRAKALTAVVELLQRSILEEKPALSAADCERVRRICENGDRLRDELRKSRQAVCAEWIRLNQEKYFLCTMRNAAQPAATRVDVTG